MTTMTLWTARIDGRVHYLRGRWDAKRGEIEGGRTGCGLSGTLADVVEAVPDCPRCFNELGRTLAASVLEEEVGGSSMSAGKRGED